MKTQLLLVVVVFSVFASGARLLANSFADGPLIKAKNSPAIYVVYCNARHLIRTPQNFEALGYDWRRVQNLAPPMLEAVTKGNDIQNEGDFEAAVKCMANDPPSFPMYTYAHTYFRGSQHVYAPVTLSNDGSIRSTFVMENDSLNGAL